jgi:hypothetical protein
MRTAPDAPGRAFHPHSALCRSRFVPVIDPGRAGFFRRVSMAAGAHPRLGACGRLPREAGPRNSRDRVGLWHGPLPLRGSVPSSKTRIPEPG